MEQTTSAEIAQVENALPSAQKVENTVYVNGVEQTGSEEDISEAINVAVKGAIMRAQGATASFHEGLGWVKNPQRATVGVRGQLAVLRVPEWNPLDMDHEEWKHHAATRIKKTLAQIDALSKYIDRAKAAPNEVINEARKVETKKVIAETTAGQPVDEAETPQPKK